MINLKKIPSIDEILTQEEILQLITRYKRDFVVETARTIVAEIREELRSVTEEIDKMVVFNNIVEKIKSKAESSNAGTLQRVINGTGVVLHTNLGRAPLAERAINHMQDIGRSYNNLEMDLDKGERGSRYYHVEDLLIRLTGADAALVVNNNAAAVMLGLTTLAAGKEVIVSRGQLVEIGGAFRIPEVMKLSGARLVEVGTTNKTYVSDYDQAINNDTALLFSAHTSNYQIIGFTSEVSMKELVSLGKEKGLPVFMDLGSGILTTLDDGGLSAEPTVQECVKAGADIITFSGDKMLGGPQAGIIVGKKEYIDRMKKNQLLRALRVDKLILSALEGTLLEYLSGHPRQNIPIIRMLSYSREQMEDRAENLLRLMEARLKDSNTQHAIRLVALEDMIGGGAYPNYKLPGVGVEIEFEDISLEKAAKELRLRNPALVARRQDNKMLISVRTLLPGDEQEIIEMIAGLGDR